MNKPELEFKRESTGDAIEFYPDDEYLELRMWGKNDQVLIILDPDEIRQLINFLLYKFT